jgi:ADP-ribose pyrophosphatase
MSEQKKWKLVEKKLVWESKWMSIEDRTYNLPNGKRGEGYFHMNRTDYVLVLAFDEQNRMVVERQFRRGVDDFVYEVPAGAIDKGETPIEAAKRELKEETGYSGEGNLVKEIYTQPGFTDMKAYVVVLHITDKNGQHAREHDEEIEFEMMTMEEIEKMVKNGEIKDMGFLTALAIWKSLEEDN